MLTKTKIVKLRIENNCACVLIRKSHGPLSRNLALWCGRGSDLSFSSKYEILISYKLIINILDSVEECGLWPDGFFAEFSVFKSAISARALIRILNFVQNLFAFYLHIRIYNVLIVYAHAGGCFAHNIML